MAARGEQIRGLRDFFTDSFRASELEMFLIENGYGEVTAAVNPNAGGAAYGFNVVQELDRRGLIDAEFFERLRQERPRKQAEIDAVRALWLGASQAAATASGGPPAKRAGMPSSPIDRAALVRTLSRLDPVDMATLITMIAGAAAHISRHGAVPEQAAELIRWAESPTGPGLEAIRTALENIR
jgi:hypothetical protein